MLFIKLKNRVYKICLGIIRIIIIINKARIVRLSLRIENSFHDNNRNSMELNFNPKHFPINSNNQV